jgi:hypothetical protein
MPRKENDNDLLSRLCILCLSLSFSLFLFSIRIDWCSTHRLDRHVRFIGSSAVFFKTKKTTEEKNQRLFSLVLIFFILAYNLFNCRWINEHLYSTSIKSANIIHREKKKARIIIIIIPFFFLLLSLSFSYHVLFNNSFSFSWGCHCCYCYLISIGENRRWMSMKGNVIPDHHWW